MEKGEKVVIFGEKRENKYNSITLRWDNYPK